MKRLGRTRRSSCWALTVLAAGSLLGCGPDDGPKDLNREQLMDPEQCKSCHPSHYDEWAGSMHAYAADDPVFLAMNARGQEETNGALGDFCVNCHAPMAVRSGQTSDGLNLAELPQHLKGVTCFFCHSADSINGTHNNPIGLSDDEVLRASISDPLNNSGHHAGYSALLDRDQRSSADLCGSCHDIVTPADVHLERTYSEWQQTLFGKAPTQLTCANCHMPGRSAPAADYQGVTVREVHDHSMPGVDVALTSWPFRAEQLAMVQDELDSTLVAQICVAPPDSDLPVTVRLENAFAGHNFPSGAAHDRRVWVELLAFVGDQQVFSSGAVSADQAVAELADPQLWLMRDHALDAQGQDAHMFWDVRSVQSELLPQATAPTEPHFQARGYNVPLDGGIPDRVAIRVLMRPLGREVLADLVASGHLNPSDFSDLPTFTVVNTIEWRNADQGYGCVPAGLF